MTSTDDDRERKTEPTNEPPDARLHMPAMLPRAPLPTGMLTPDPNSYQDFALSQLLERARGLDTEQAALPTMPKIAELFVQHEASLKAELKELDRRTQTSLDAVIHQTRVMGTRLGLVEAQRETDAEKLERLQLDMVAFKTQVEQRIRAMSDDIAQMRAHVGGA